MGAERFTVLGGRGFIGSRLARHLADAGHHCDVPTRDDDLTGRDLGHVIFCIGVTGDFRARPLDTVDAHVRVLVDLVRSSTFESLVYLSSTRVYKRHSGATAREADHLVVNPVAGDDLYGMSKMMGESVALAASGARTHVVRLSNVYGDDFDQPGFLPAILREAVTTGTITLQTSRASERDYVSVDDAVGLITRIAIEGTERVYNVASGVNVSNGDLADKVAALTGCRVAERAGAETVRFPRIDIRRIQREFDAAPAAIADALPGLVESSARHWSSRVLD